MLKWLSQVNWFVTEAQAVKLGCTHRARLHGIIPGFVGDVESDGPIWVSRSDLLNPIEDFLSFMWMLACNVTGREEMWGFALGDEIRR